jgi:deoxyadenosine/deoxycytidine kinase
MELRHHLLKDLPLPHFTIFLDVSPQTCYDRIHQLRQRNCESSIPLEYLDGLDDCYRRLLGELQDKGSQVLSFNWNNFGSPESIAKGLDILSMSSMDEAQHLRVLHLLKTLEQKDAVDHLWPSHLSPHGNVSFF